MISFASDNFASVLPAVMDALARANQGHAVAYGGDSHTASAIALIQSSLNTSAPVWFVGTGTAANVLALKCMLKDYQSIIAPAGSHIQTREAGAPHHIIGTKILTTDCKGDKITPAQIAMLHTAETSIGHHATQPRVVSISQTTESGTVYSLAELKAIRAICDELGLLLHIDGCRIYNAAAALDCSLAEIARFADILCLGGTKAGLMFGEAIVFMNKALGEGFEYRQKLGLQLFSKMRFVSAQFEALFTDDLGLRAARHANEMTLRLWQGLKASGQVQQTAPVESNQLFVTLPKPVIAPLSQAFPFLVYDQEQGIVRLITSHDTREEDVDAFLEMFTSLL